MTWPELLQEIQEFFSQLICSLQVSLFTHGGLAGLHITQGCLSGQMPPEKAPLKRYLLRGMKKVQYLKEVPLPLKWVTRSRGFHTNPWCAKVKGMCEVWRNATASDVKNPVRVFRSKFFQEQLDIGRRVYQLSELHLQPRCEHVMETAIELRNLESTKPCKNCDDPNALNLM